MRAEDVLARPYLTRTEDAIITALEKRRGRVVSREQLSMIVYGHTYPDRVLDVHIRRIRGKLGRGVIETRVGYGYTLGKARRCECCEGAGWIVG